MSRPDLPTLLALVVLGALPALGQAAASTDAPTSLRVDAPQPVPSPPPHLATGSPQDTPTLPEEAAPSASPGLGGGPSLATPGSPPQRHVDHRPPPLIPSARPALLDGERETDRFRILHTRRAARAAEQLAERIEATRDGLQRFLGRDWPGVTEIRLGADREEMAKLALPGGDPPSWAAALAYPAHNIILLDASTLSGAEGVDTLWHELTHVALGRLGQGWPRWFQEGLAVHLTGSRFDPNRYTTLFGAVRADRILAFEDLTMGWPDHPQEVTLAYAQSAAFVGWLHERHGTQGMARLVDAVQAGDHFELAFAKAFSLTLDSEETRWQAGLAERYGWLPVTSITTLVLGFAALLCVLGWSRRRKQLALRLAQMEAQEVAEEAAHRLLEAELRAQEDALSRLRAPPHVMEALLPPELERRSPPDDPLASEALEAWDEDEEEPPTPWPPRDTPPKPTLH